MEENINILSIHDLEEVLDECYQLPSDLAFMGKENLDYSIDQKEMSYMLLGLAELYKMKFEKIKEIMYEIGDTEKEKHSKVMESYCDYLNFKEILKDEKI
ncbi:hypothetical protein HOB87_10105 [Candidatus Woesearchaeota archaeon]|jgi:hypothetical protein|nr:hypothetical protein [Candidatus Woesearchaeota archaeon]